MKFIYKQLAFLLLLSSVAFATDTSFPVTSAYRSCEPGLHNQPNGPFAVMLFCEDALATHLGVIYKEKMSSPVDGAWFISDRFWQVSVWASDVTAYAWEPSGKYLLISTSPIYGTGNVYRLDLKQRQHTVVFNYPGFNAAKGEESCMVEMVSLNAKESTIDLELTYCDQEIIETISVSY